MKSLIKKFSYNGIVDELDKQGWNLPSADDVRSSSIEHDIIWVSDKPRFVEDHETHACIYDRQSDSVDVVNKSFMFNVAVVVKPKSCTNCKKLDWCHVVPVVNIVEFSCYVHEFKGVENVK